MCVQKCISRKIEWYWARNFSWKLCIWSAKSSPLSFDRVRGGSPIKARFNFLFCGSISRTESLARLSPPRKLCLARFLSFGMSNKTIKTLTYECYGSFESLNVSGLPDNPPSIFIRTHLLLRGRFFSRSRPILPRPREQYKPLWIDLDLLPMRLFSGNLRQ